MINIQQLTKQAQDLQKKMNDVQQQLGSAEISGVSGGGLVSVIASGKGDIKKIKIDKSLIVQEEVEILEDLIVAALNNAKHNADLFMADEMKKIGLSADMLKGIL